MHDNPTVVFPLLVLHTCIHFAHATSAPLQQRASTRGSLLEVVSVEIERSTHYRSHPDEYTLQTDNCYRLQKHACSSEAKNTSCQAGTDPTGCRNGPDQTSTPCSKPWHSWLIDTPWHNKQYVTFLMQARRMLSVPHTTASGCKHRCKPLRHCPDQRKQLSIPCQQTQHIKWPTSVTDGQ